MAVQIYTCVNTSSAKEAFSEVNTEVKNKARNK